jgi:hypothetical protein
MTRETGNSVAIKISDPDGKIQKTLENPIGNVFRTEIDVNDNILTLDPVESFINVFDSKGDSVRRIRTPKMSYPSGFCANSEGDILMLSGRQKHRALMISDSVVKNPIMAARIYALVVLIENKILRIAYPVEDQKKASFFCIMEKLPIDLQQIVCNRLRGLKEDIIPHKTIAKQIRLLEKII